MPVNFTLGCLSPVSKFHFCLIFTIIIFAFCIVLSLALFKNTDYILSLTTLSCSSFSGDNNQIVTIVPSHTNPGEVSYVLIVEQSSDADKDDTVYDFNEADEGLSYVSCV